MAVNRGVRRALVQVVPRPMVPCSPQSQADIQAVLGAVAMDEKSCSETLLDHFLVEPSPEDSRWSNADGGGAMADGTWRRSWSSTSTSRETPAGMLRAARPPPPHALPPAPHVRLTAAADTWHSREGCTPAASPPRHPTLAGGLPPRRGGPRSPCWPS
jgi:hypothetical protein